MIAYRLQATAIGVLLLIVSHIGLYVYGWHKGAGVERLKWQAEKAQMMIAAEARANVLREQGDRLAAELEIARTAVRTIYVDRIKTVYRTASPTRQALSADVTAALNRDTPIRETVHRAGEPPAVVVHGGASELATAEWIANTQAMYADCVTRFRALADWARAASGGRK
jgi:hypothetical protein